MQTSLYTNYVGLNLQNPIIVSSSGLTNNIERIKAAQQAGAGAIVLKSIFEEQLNIEANELLTYNEYPEAADYIRNYSKNNSLEKYIKLISDAKSEVKIPIFASINCVSVKDWTKFAKQIESAGADAIELNIYILPTDKNKKGSRYEDAYFDIVKQVSKSIKIPVIAKIGANFSNLTAAVEQLKNAGAKAVVLFNRTYEPDIDIENLKITAAEVFSSPSDIRNSLRWVAITSAIQNAPQISASTGIHDGKAVVKQLLAGATTVQLCSVLYKNGLEHIKLVSDFLLSWMAKHNYTTIADFRGKMNYKNIKDPLMYERVQFMKYYSSID